MDDSQIDSFLPNSSPTLLSWNFSNLNAANDMDTGGSIRNDPAAAAAKTMDDDGDFFDSDLAKGKSG